MSIYLLVFMLGTSVASFLNVVAKSVPIHQNWWSRRSICPHCHTILTPFQLIPIFSFLIQKGHCKHCRSKIAPSYLFVEIVGGLLFTLPVIYHPIPSFIFLLHSWLFFSLLLTVTLTDLHYQLIPNKILIAFALPLFLTGGNLLTASIGFFFFYGVALFGKMLFNKETIGGGDIKLYFVIGLVLPFHPLFLSITISSAVALIYLLFSGKNKSLPYAPFIALGSMVAYLVFIY